MVEITVEVEPVDGLVLREAWLSFDDPETGETAGKITRVFSGYVMIELPDGKMFSLSMRELFMKFMDKIGS